MLAYYIRKFVTLHPCILFSIYCYFMLRFEIYLSVITTPLQKAEEEIHVYCTPHAML